MSLHLYQDQNYPNENDIHRFEDRRLCVHKEAHTSLCIHVDQNYKRRNHCPKVLQKRILHTNSALINDVQIHYLQLPGDVPFQLLEISEELNI